MNREFLAAKKVETPGVLKDRHIKFSKTYDLDVIYIALKVVKPSLIHMSGNDMISTAHSV